MKTHVVGIQKNRLGDSSFEHPKHNFRQIDKKIIAILRWSKFLPILTFYIKAPFFFCIFRSHIVSSVS